MVVTTTAPDDLSSERPNELVYRSGRLRLTVGIDAVMQRAPGGECLQLRSDKNWELDAPVRNRSDTPAAG